MKSTQEKFYQKRKIIYLGVIGFFLLLFIIEFFFPYSSQKKTKKTSEEFIQEKVTRENQEIPILDDETPPLIYPASTITNELGSALEQVGREDLVEDYYFFFDDLDLEKYTREHFLSEKKLSNETFNLIQDFKEEVFVTDELFDYEEEIHKDIFDAEINQD